MREIDDDDDDLDVSSPAVIVRLFVHYNIVGMITMYTYVFLLCVHEKNRVRNTFVAHTRITSKMHLTRYNVRIVYNVCVSVYHTLVVLGVVYLYIVLGIYRV